MKKTNNKSVSGVNNGIKPVANAMKNKRYSKKRISTGEIYEGITLKDEMMNL